MSAPESPPVAAPGSPAVVARESQAAGESSTAGESRAAVESPAAAGSPAVTVAASVDGRDASAAAPVPSRETIHHPGADALDLAQILRTVGDPLRLAMVRDLATHDELLCGALGERLGLPKSTGSYHLRLLREAGLTRTRQEGTLRFVSLRRADLETRFPGLIDVLAAGGRG